VEAVDEGGPGGGQQGVGRGGGEAAGGLERAAERLVGRAGEWAEEGAGDVVAVDGGAEAAEDRDAERAAELLAGLGQRGRRPVRAAGAAVITTSVINVTTAARPIVVATAPIRSVVSPSWIGVRVSTANPASATRKPPLATYHYGSKEALLNAALMSATGDFGEGLDAAVASVPGAA
jgi:hypothetical protein